MGDAKIEIEVINKFRLGIFKKATLFNFDKVLGLDLAKLKKAKVTIPKEVQALVKARAEARKDKDWAKSDELRDKILGLRYLVEDTSEGAVVKSK